MPKCAICSKPLDVTPIRNRVTCSAACREAKRRRVAARRRAEEDRRLARVLRAASAAIDGDAADELDRLACRLLAR